MIGNLMTLHRRAVLAVLGAAFVISQLLYLVWGSGSGGTRATFAAISLVLAPLAYFGTYFVLYMQTKNRMRSPRAFRFFCIFFFGGAAAFTILNTIWAVVGVVSQGIPPPGNPFAVGVAAAALVIWKRYVDSTALKPTQQAP